MPAAVAENPNDQIPMTNQCPGTNVRIGPFRHSGLIENWRAARDGLGTAVRRIPAEGMPAAVAENPNDQIPMTNQCPGTNVRIGPFRHSGLIENWRAARDRLGTAFRRVPEEGMPAAVAENPNDQIPMTNQCPGTNVRIGLFGHSGLIENWRLVIGASGPEGASA
jgi:hypothetical protein